MNIENKEILEKTTSVLDKIMNFFKRVINQQTITDKGTLHHAGDIDEGAEVYLDEDMTTPAITDVYTTADGKKLAVKSGQVQQVTSPDTEEEDTDSKSTAQAGPTHTTPTTHAPDAADTALAAKRENQLARQLQTNAT